MANIFNNPQALAGLAMIGGPQFEDMIKATSMANLQQQQAQAIQSEQAQRAMMMQSMSQGVPPIDPNDPGGSFRRLIQMGLDPAQANDLIQAAQKAAQQQSLDKMRDFVLGGGQGNAVLNNGQTPSTVSAPQGDEAELERARKLLLIPEFAPYGKSLIDTISEKRKEAKTREKEIRDATIPNYEIIEGSAPPPQAVGKAMELSSVQSRYENVASRIKDFIRKEGSATGIPTPFGRINSTAKQDADSLINEMLQVDRAFNETGVLNQGEVPILKEAFAPFDPTNLTNLARSKEEMVQNVDKFLDSRRGVLASKMEGYGYKSKKQAQSKAPKQRRWKVVQ